MSILGNDSGVGSDTTSFANGRAWAAKWIAPVDGVISEFHIEYDSGQETLDLGVYGPGGTNQPGARLGDAGTVQTNTTGTVHQFITGLSIPFPAGAVWLAAACETNFGGHLLSQDGTGASGEWSGISSAKLSGAYPLPDPFPTIDFGPDDRKFRMWVVYSEDEPCNPPVSEDDPTIAGTTAVGDTLTYTEGGYSGDPTIVVTHEWWRRCGSDEEVIAGETGTTYDTQSDDIGCNVFVRETADNGCSPNAVVDSNEIGPIEDTPHPPTNITPPVITGVASEGHLLTGSDGTWTFPPILDFDYQWYLDCGGGPVAIVGETTDTIETDETMIGCTLLIGVIATNADGSSDEAFSDPFGPITANIPAAPRFYQSPPWRFVVGDRATFETLSFLDHIATERNATFVLNGPAVAIGVVPADDPEVNIPWPSSTSEPFLAEGNRVLWGFRREGTPDSETDGPWVIRYAGIIMQLEDVAQSDDAFTHYTAYDPWQYLFSRPVCNEDGSLPGENGLSFDDTRADVIALTLLRNTIENHGTVHIDAGDDWGGTGDYAGTVEECVQIDINFPAGTTVGEAWQQLAQMDIIDIVLRPIYDPISRPGYLVEFNASPQAGGFQNDAIFAWDKPSRSLTGISRVKDGTVRSNVVKFFAGQGGSALNGRNIPPAEDAASKAKYGEYWRMTFWPGQNVAAAVQALAATQLALAKDGRTTVTISPAPERSPIPFQEYYLGDRVPVYASQRFREEIPPGADIEYQRIYGIPVDIADDQTETIRTMLTAVQQ